MASRDVSSDANVLVSSTSAVPSDLPSEQEVDGNEVDSHFGPASKRGRSARKKSSRKMKSTGFIFSIVVAYYFNVHLLLFEKQMFQYLLPYIMLKNFQSSRIDLLFKDEHYWPLEIYSDCIRTFQRSHNIKWICNVYRPWRSWQSPQQPIRRPLKRTFLSLELRPPVY